LITLKLDEELLAKYRAADKYPLGIKYVSVGGSKPVEVPIGGQAGQVLILDTTQKPMRPRWVWPEEAGGGICEDRDLGRSAGD
jgi:hypothetical protein